MTACVCVFAKPPRPGLVKTRLALKVGDEVSARFARAFLHDTWAVAASLDDSRPILATTDPSDQIDGLGDVERWPQGEGDLGQKLQRILERGLKSYNHVIAIGSDAPDLPRACLREAVAGLAIADAVIAPARDGGFVLLAVSGLPTKALHLLPWSSERTCEALLERFRTLNMRVTVIDGWEDVDDYQALGRLHRRIVKGDAAPCSRLLLDELQLS